MMLLTELLVVLLLILVQLPLPAVCNADVDGDGIVAVGDVLEVIATWGSTG